MVLLIRVPPVFSAPPFPAQPLIQTVETAEPPLDSDIRLARSASVTAEKISIGELLASLERQAGVPLSAEASVGEEKVILYYPPRPLHEILRDVAILVGGKWSTISAKPGAVSYRLSYAPRTRAVEKSLQGAALNLVQTTLQRDYETGRRGNPRESNAQRQEEESQTERARLGILLYGLCGLLESAQCQRLFSEGVLRVSLRDMAPNIKAAVRDALITIREEEKKFARQSALQGLSVPVTEVGNIDDRQLLFRVLKYGNQYDVVCQLNQSPLGSLPVGAVTCPEWLVPQFGVPYSRKHESDPVPTIDGIDPGVLRRLPHGFGAALRYLSEQMDAPVLADYYSVPGKRSGDGTPGTNYGATLADAVNSVCSENGCCWWVGGRSLFFRKRDWYDKRAYEPPASWLRAAFDTAGAGGTARRKSCTYQDLFRLTALTPQQIVGLKRLSGDPVAINDEYETVSLRRFILLMQGFVPDPSAPLHDGEIRTPQDEQQTTVVMRVKTTQQSGAVAGFLDSQTYPVSPEDYKQLFASALLVKGSSATPPPGLTFHSVYLTWMGERDRRLGRARRGRYNIELPASAPADFFGSINVTLGDDKPSSGGR